MLEGALSKHIACTMIHSNSKINRLDALLRFAGSQRFCHCPLQVTLSALLFNCPGYEVYCLCLGPYSSQILFCPAVGLSNGMFEDNHVRSWDGRYNTGFDGTQCPSPHSTRSSQSLSLPWEEQENAAINDFGISLITATVWWGFKSLPVGHIQVWSPVEGVGIVANSTKADLSQTLALQLSVRIVWGKNWPCMPTIRISKQIKFQQACQVLMHQCFHPSFARRRKKIDFTQVSVSTLIWLNDVVICSTC